MAINFGDGSVQSFSAKVIQVKRALRTTEIQTSSSSMSDVSSISFTPKSSSSRIRCEFTCVAYIQQEPGGMRGRFYDHTDSNRFGTSLSSDDPLLYRFDFQGGHSGAVYSYAGVTWRADEASWGTSAKEIKFQIALSGNGSTGIISSFLPATFTISEEME